MQLTLAKPDDLSRAHALFKLAYEDMGQAVDDAQLSAGLEAVLGGHMQAAVYLIGPANAPVGVMSISFGFNVAHNGMLAIVDLIYIRNAVRRRGLGAWAISTLVQTLKNHGVYEVRLHMHATDAIVSKLAQAAGLKPLPSGGGFGTRVM